MSCYLECPGYLRNAIPPPFRLRRNIPSLAGGESFTARPGQRLAAGSAKNSYF